MLKSLKYLKIITFLSFSGAVLPVFAETLFEDAMFEEISYFDGERYYQSAVEEAAGLLAKDEHSRLDHPAGQVNGDTAKMSGFLRESTNYESIEKNVSAQVSISSLTAANQVSGLTFNPLKQDWSEYLLSFP